MAKYWSNKEKQDDVSLRKIEGDWRKWQGRSPLVHQCFYQCCEDVTWNVRQICDCWSQITSCHSNSLLVWEVPAFYLKNACEEQFSAISGFTDCCWICCADACAHCRIVSFTKLWTSLEYVCSLLIVYFSSLAVWFHLQYSEVLVHAFTLTCTQLLFCLNSILIIWKEEIRIPETDPNLQKSFRSGWTKIGNVDFS